MTHLYVSTYCQHDRHGDCRLTCKVCAAPCLCPCPEHAAIAAARMKTSTATQPTEHEEHQP